MSEKPIIFSTPMVRVILEGRKTMTRRVALQKWCGRKMITVEPVMDFNVQDFAEMILECKPEQVNIGADSGRNGLPEPPAWKIGALVKALEGHTKVHLKRNLSRIYRG